MHEEENWDDELPLLFYVYYNYLECEKQNGIRKMSTQETCHGEVMMIGLFLWQIASTECGFKPAMYRARDTTVKSAFVCSSNTMANMASGHRLAKTTKENGK